jgi:hypothetical protein
MDDGEFPTFSHIVTVLQLDIDQEKESTFPFEYIDLPIIRFLSNVPPRSPRAFDVNVNSTLLCNLSRELSVSGFVSSMGSLDW